MKLFHFFLVLLLLCFAIARLASTAPAPASEQIVIGTGMSELLRVSNLRRAAIANGKIAKAKAVKPDGVLLTGKSLGVTMLRVWDKQGTTRSFEIRVVSMPEYENLVGRRGQVVKVSIDFVEVSTNSGEELGIEWPKMLEFSATGHLQWNGQTGLNYSVTSQTSDGFLRAMVDEGWARLLAQPKFYVRLGEEAEFHSGGEIPIITTHLSRGRIYKKVIWKKYGLTAKVLPRSVDGKRIHALVDVDLKEIEPTEIEDGIPSFTNRSLKTKIDTLDSHTVFLSGLVRKTQTRKERRFPVLGAIPLLGIFFSATQASEERRELILALRLNVLSSPEKAPNVELLQ